MKANFTVVGAGYVGMSLSVLLSRFHNVILLDIDKSKVNDINAGKSTIQDDLIDSYIKNKELNLNATTNSEKAFNNSDFIIIATPTDYDHKKRYFDTSTIEKVIEALYDNLYPSRIIVGGKCKRALNFMNILKDCSENKNVKLLSMNALEAESVKLFANSYLAMRVAFFNELDNFAITNNLNTKDIIDGISFDNRIGNYYNNPSFGYGGYCFPKDTQQLLANFKDIPQNIIEAIVESNKTRKSFLIDQIKKINPKVVGLYKLQMKSNSDR